MKKILAYTGLVTTMLIWSVTFVWSKQIMNAGISPTMLVFLRLTSVALLILPIFMISGQFRKIHKKDIRLFMLMAFFEPFLYFIGEANGIKHVSPNIASIIIATIPLFLPFFARFILNEKLSFINYIGMAVSFSGVILIILDKGGKISASPIGLMYLFFAVFSAVGYTILARHMLSRYSPLFISTLKILIAWIYFIPVFLIFDLPAIQTIAFSKNIILLIFALGLGGNLTAYFLFNNSIKQIGASKSSIFSNLIPVFTVVFSFYILHEVVPLIKLAGIGLALCGIYISQIQFFKPKKAILSNDSQ